jgi:flagella basal body P-ring formation protein FlgA
MQQQATYIDAMPQSPTLARPARALRRLAFTWLAPIALPALAVAGQAAWAQTTRTTATESHPAETSAPEAGVGSGIGIALEQQVRQLALSGTQAGAPLGTAGLPRFEIVIGQLDPRLRLAPCQHVDPYLPEGTRLWGKGRIGLRCTQGVTKWNVYLPVTVKAFGPALVAAGNASAGSVLTAADLVPGEVDLADDASPAVMNADLAVGRALARPLKAGQGLRQSHLKPRQWFAAGDSVTVVAQGAGFSVAGEAQALTNGIEGQPARVRTEAGRVLTGQPVGDRRLELSL